MIESTLNWAIEWFESGHWVTRVFLVALTVVSINLLLKLLLKRIGKRIERTDNVWDDALFEALSAPLRALVWIIGLSIAAEMVDEKARDELFDLVDPVRRVAVIATIAWFVLRLVRRVEANLILRSEREGKDVDHTTVDAIAKLIRASVMITATLVILQTLGFSISGVLAFGGVGGLAVGFAAKDMLSNFFGGLTVYLDKPFKVGDWIRSPDNEIEGTVEQIGWRSTRVRRFDKRPIYVPNALFTHIIVENPSRMTHRRIYEQIGVRYDDIEQVPAILNQIREMLQQHEGIDQDQTIIVNFTQFGASSLDFMLYCLTRTTNWIEYHEVKQDVLLKVSEIVMEHDAEIAFPTRTLHLASPDLSGALAAPQRAPESESHQNQNANPESGKPA